MRTKRRNPCDFVGRHVGTKIENHIGPIVADLAGIHDSNV